MSDKKREQAALLGSMARAERDDARTDLQGQHDAEDREWKLRRARALEAGARALRGRAR